ncbi:MAG TPA: hypothetical protein VMW53_07385 [archaeon]|nr:hypothetical protein [archaeon]
MELKLTKEQVTRFIKNRQDHHPYYIDTFLINVAKDWLILCVFKENVEIAILEMQKEKVRRMDMGNEEQLIVGVGISVANDILQKAVKNDK